MTRIEFEKDFMNGADLGLSGRGDNGLGATKDHRNEPTGCTAMRLL